MKAILKIPASLLIKSPLVAGPGKLPGFIKIWNPFAKSEKGCNSINVIPENGDDDKENNLK